MVIQLTPGHSGNHSIIYYSFYYQFWYKAVARLLIVGMIPFVVFIVMNLKIYLAIKKVRSKTANNETGNVELEQVYRLFIIVAIYFAILTFYVAKKFYLIYFIPSLKDVTCLYECLRRLPFWVKVIIILYSFLQSKNDSLFFT